jgi:hypothetical protein
MRIRDLQSGLMEVFPNGNNLNIFSLAHQCHDFVEKMASGPFRRAFGRSLTRVCINHDRWGADDRRHGQPPDHLA